MSEHGPQAVIWRARLVCEVLQLEARCTAKPLNLLSDSAALYELDSTLEAEVNGEKLRQRIHDDGNTHWYCPLCVAGTRKSQGMDLGMDL